MSGRNNIWLYLAIGLSTVALAGIVVTFLLQRPTQIGGDLPRAVSPAHTTAATPAAPATEPYHHETALAEVLLATVRDLGIAPDQLTDPQLATQAAAATVGLDRPLLPAGQCAQLRAVPRSDRSDAVSAALRVCNALPEAP